MFSAPHCLWFAAVAAAVVAEVAAVAAAALADRSFCRNNAVVHPIPTMSDSRRRPDDSAAAVAAARPTSPPPAAGVGVGVGVGVVVDVVVVYSNVPGTVLTCCSTLRFRAHLCVSSRHDA